jgi:hypothetical protein
MSEFNDYITCKIQLPLYGKLSLSPQLLMAIMKNVPEGAILLELGSGRMTEFLNRFYTVWSIEHDEAYLNKYHDRYIHAPLVDYFGGVKYPECTTWYDPEVLKAQLPKDYDAILVDGPPGGGGRGGFDTYFDLFKQDVPLFFDDVQRNSELHLVRNIAKKLIPKEFVIQNIKERKMFAAFNINDGRTDRFSGVRQR